GGGDKLGHCSVSGSVVQGFAEADVDLGPFPGELAAWVCRFEHLDEFERLSPRHGRSPPLAARDRPPIAVAVSTSTRHPESHSPTPPTSGPEGRGMSTRA